MLSFIIMKLIFCGTPAFAIPSLKSLLASSHKILAVVTQPDRPAGRGRKLHSPAVKEAALAAGLPVLQPLRIGEPASLENLRQLQPDALVVVAYGQFLPRSVLELPKYGCINVHASLLPRYRGAAPINWAVIRGERQTGITTMRLDEGMDSGDIILRQAIPLDTQETAGSLHDKLAPLGAEVLLSTLEQIEAGTARYEPQDKSKASYAPAIKKVDTMIHWEQPAQEIERLVRGLNPHPGARTHLQGFLLKVLAVEVSSEPPSPPGQIVRGDKKRGILVGTGSAPLWLKTIQPPNRAPMQAGDYLSGLREKLEGGSLS